MFGNFAQKWGWVRLVPSPAKMGYHAEIFVTDWLTDALGGKFAAKHVGTGNGCDIVLTNLSTGEQVNIEVKAARVGLDGKYRATLEKSRATSAFEHADFVIFLCIPPVGEAVPFIIPCRDIPARRSLAVSSHPAQYAGKFAKYRNAIDLIGA